MKVSNVLLAAALSATAHSAAYAADLPSMKAPAFAPIAPSGFLFSDTQVYFMYKPWGREPGIANLPPNQNAGTNINKYIFGVTHFDAWTYGTNFFNAEFLQSGTKDPPAFAGATANTGAVEVYGLYRGTLSFNALSNSKMFSFGPVKDISFGFGVDANSKNTVFGPAKKLVVAGPRIDFDVPGVLAVQFNISHEWNYNGIVGKGVTFRTAPEIEFVYSQSLSFTGLPLTLTGFTNIVLPKGKDGFGNYTKTEVNSDTRLVLDAGKVLGYQPGVFDLFVGYKYWLNKFGNDSQLRSAGPPYLLINPGSVESTIFAGAAWHVFSGSGVVPTPKSANFAGSPGAFGFLFEDTQVYFNFKPFGREPGIGRPAPNQSAGQDIRKYIFGATHFDVWQYGTNFFNVEYLQSDFKDPPVGAATNAYVGADEVYGLYRGTLSFNSISGTKTFNIGPFKDLSFGFGFDANTKNTSFASEKKLIVAGPRIDFDVPGVLGVQFNVSHEWNYNGIVGKPVSFRVTPEIEVVYAQPLTFTGLPLSIAGFTNFILPKGLDGFKQYTKLEINSETKLVLDIGKVVGYKPGVFDLYVGYKYWLNKFGADSHLRTTAYPYQLSNPGSVESTVFTGLAWHIF